MFGILQELAALFSLWGGCPTLAWTWLAVEAGVSPCCARALPCPAFPKGCAAWILTPKPFRLPWTDLDLQGLAFSQCHLTLQEAWCEEVPCLCLGQGNSAFLLCHLWFLWTLQTSSPWLVASPGFGRGDRIQRAGGAWWSLSAVQREACDQASEGQQCSFSAATRGLQTSCGVPQCWVGEGVCGQIDLAQIGLTVERGGHPAVPSACATVQWGRIEWRPYRSPDGPAVSSPGETGLKLAV